MQKSFNNILTLLTLILALSWSNILSTHAQDEKEQNRPYTDLRPLHFGIVVGGNLQDTKLSNVGPIVLEDQPSEIYCDQNTLDLGFNVGVLMEARLNQYFAFRVAPQLYFGTRNFTLYNKLNPDANIVGHTQTLRTVYVGADLDFICAAQRWNNHRPYLMFGLAPMMNLTSNTNEYVKLKKSEVFLEAGIGCDLYLPFFKFRPELKFMYGLTNCLDTDRDIKIDDPNYPYVQSINKARSQMIVLSFYFE